MMSAARQTSVMTRAVPSLSPSSANRFVSMVTPIISNVWSRCSSAASPTGFFPCKGPG